MSTQNCPKCFFLNPADAANCGRCGADLRTAAETGFFPEQVVDGRYRLVRRIGEGGMAEVWEAVQLGIDVRVAMKFLHASLMRHGTARDRVRKASQALGRLRRSDRVITIYDYFETAATVVQVLEFADEGTLAERIDTHGRVPVADALVFIDGVLQGVQAIHAEGLVHRDIKPDNILLTRDGADALIPKVADLGIVHTVDGTRLTADGSQLGTLEYMAPELFDTHEPSAQSDIYACGILLYELLVGEAPFTGSQVQIMRGQCMVPPDLEWLPAEVPTCVRKALEKALAKAPEDRFTDCAIFRKALIDSADVAHTRGRGGSGRPIGMSVPKITPTPNPKPRVKSTPNTLLIASGSYDHTVRLWHASDGRLLRTLEGHTEPVFSVAFSPDGQIVASGAGDTTICLWEAHDGRHLRTLKGHTSYVRSVTFSPDGQIIASGADDGTIRLWDANDGRHLRTLENHTSWVRSVSFSADGQTIASGSDDKTIRLWNTSDGFHLHTLEGHTNYVGSVAFSPDGQTIASGSRDNTIRLWNATDGRHLRTLPGPTHTVFSVTFSPDGQTIASGYYDYTIRLWNPRDGRHLRALEGHTDIVMSVTFSPDGQTIASGSDDTTIRLWNASDGRHLRTLEGHTDTVNSVAFSCG